MDARRKAAMKHKDSKPAGRGNAAPQQGETNQRTHRAPHERDESADGQSRDEPSQGRMADIGRADVQRGLVDTDKGPAMQEAYDKTRAGTPDPDKKFSP
jgi:hypothetical protein